MSDATPPKLSNPRPLTETQGWLFGYAADGYPYECWTLLYNDRLVLRSMSGYRYGWCFPKSKGGLLAFAAFLAWDPETQDEPPGWIKRNGPVRRAPRRDPAADHNQPRCPHGHYPHLGRCPADLLCRLQDR